MKYSIAFDGDIFARQQNGGISVHFYHLISNLSVSRKVHLFYHQSKRIAVKTNQYFHLLSKNKAIVIHEYSSVIGLKHFIITNHISIIAATYYSLIPLLLRLPTIYTFHDAGQIRFITKYLTFSRFLAIIAQFLTLNLSSGISTVSSFAKSELFRYYILPPLKHKKPIYVTGNSSSLPLPTFNPNFSSNNSPLNLLYIGTRSNNKKFLSILPVLAKLQNEFPCVLNICGGASLTAYELQALRLYDINFVHKMNLSSSQLVDAYSQADIFIHSSMYEGFGITILEALSHSLLTVAIKIPPVYEIAGDSIIYSKSNSPKDLYLALRNAMSISPELRFKLLESGYNKASKFDWQSVSQKFDALVLDVLK